MKIGFDIDGVLIPSVKYVDQLASERFGRLFQHTRYHSEDMFGVSKFESEFIASCFRPEVIGKITPHLDTIMLFHKIKIEHEVMILTSRIPDEKGLFYTYAQCLPFFETEPMFCNGRSKWEVLRDEGVELYVEDCYEYAKKIQDHGFTECLLLNTPYNRGFIHPYPKRNRINSLSELPQAIEYFRKGAK